MPPLRVMNWNIQTLSDNKIAIPTMADRLARVIAIEQPDIVVIVEVRTTNVGQIMNALSAAANAQMVAVLGVPTRFYTMWVLSHPTGNEHYAFLIKDANQVRPTMVAPINANDPDGSPNNPLTTLAHNTFTTWPFTFAAQPNLYAGGVPAWPASVHQPLVNVFSRRTANSLHARQFSGQQLGAGGYAMGHGFRLPGLAIFDVNVGASRFFLPILVCHFGAVRSGANHLARGQVRQFSEIDLCQRYANQDYIAVNGAAEPVADLVITGDFNMDFQVNQAAGATHLARINRDAYSTITPTEQGQGSANPGPIAGPFGPAPALPLPVPASETIMADIRPLNLRAGVTNGGTILTQDYPSGAANTAALRTAAFDNLFYNGAHLTGPHDPTVLAAPDAATVVDVPFHIATKPGIGAPAVAFPNLDVSAIQQHYATTGVRNSTTMDGLELDDPTAAPLSIDARLIGAGFLSDHLPVYVEFNLA